VDCLSANKDNDLSHDTDLNDLFFDQFFHQLLHMQRLLHADHGSPFHTTVTNEKIKFEDPEAEDLG
jgi:hypothetical protein